jgi:pSer/pThr/pTyr-binding forkhead associated (FHA) protein
MYAALILVNSEPELARKHSLEDFPVVLGRGPNADVQVSDPWVSRNHCVIDASECTLIVKDLDTSNGTFVNGCEVVVAPLMPGDHLIIGTHVFRVAYQRSSLDPPPPTIYRRQPKDDQETLNTTQPL